MVSIEPLTDEYMAPPIYVEYNDIPVIKSEVLRYSGSSASMAISMDRGEDDVITALKKRCEACGKKCEFSFGQGDGNKRFCPEDDNMEGIDRLYREVEGLLAGKLTFRLVYSHIRLDANEQELPVLEFFRNSNDLMKNLEGCNEAILFAATIGSGIDMLIRRFERIEPAKALMLQAFGAERVESLCDRFNDELKLVAKNDGVSLRPRYSPGYGDLSLAVQPLLLKLLNAEKRLGIALNESLLMMPSKSVTAIIGIEK